MISKTDLRKEARRRRKAHPDIAAALARHAAALGLAPGTVVGGYHALPDEADPALLLKELVTRGCHIAFPRIAGAGMKLDFHLVPDDFHERGEVLRPGAFGVQEPGAHWPSVTPQLLLVPLLAFDSEGHRLGYGGGFYDRTLFALKNGPGFGIRAIGIGFSGQEIASLPVAAHDVALDGILTEQGLRAFR
jgi:5-formyltetrahydrofolate cyclo-ligase